MTSVNELDVYEIAYLCGGAERVALAAVIAMQQDGRITISRTRHRVKVVRRRTGRPVERAVLDAAPDAGKVLGQLLHDVAHSAAVQELIDGLRRDGLTGQHTGRSSTSVGCGAEGAYGTGGSRRDGAA